MNKEKEKLTLVILAAGMGSRFGGLKQITPMGPNGEFIIDYSIYDAVKAGFEKVVFLIKRENFEVFKETIGSRVEPHIEVVYAFQENGELADQYPALKERVKPLGTAHAVWCCREVVSTPFVMINADDFYGRDAFVQAANFLREEKSGNKQNYGMIGYLVKNTMTEYGAVKRGVCEVKDDYLVKLVESSVSKVDNKIIAEPLNGTDSFEVQENDTVSMNMLLFQPTIFSYIEKKMPEFFEKHQENLEKCEFLIPDVLFQSIEEGFATVKVLKTTSSWYGVTYQEDKESVQKAIRELVNQGEYPQHLWK